MFRIDPARRVYFDGGLGTLLHSMGLTAGERPESWNTSHPDNVRQIHAAYIEAGSEIIAANTFGATRSHMGDDAAQAMREGVRLALEAVREAGRGHAAIDMGSLGQLLRPYGDMPFEEAVCDFREAFEEGLRAGGELILIETMTDQLEAKAAVIAAREAMDATGIRVPLLCSLCFEPSGRLLTGASIEGAVAMLAGMRVDAIGMNCGHEPAALYECARRLHSCSPLPVFACPNASLPIERDGRTVFPTTPDDFAQQMRDIAALGSWGLGGCCGTTPEHIRALIQATRDLEPAPPADGLPLTISGRGATVVFGERPIVIGERLNPTGKPKLKQALREGDMDALMREAVLQADAGADVLDVNAGLPDIDEAATLPRVITAIQGVCELPLQIDTTDFAAMSSALRVYSGKPIINSVCGKRFVMDAVFPMAARYGGAIIALTLDEDGIPDTVEGRLRIARDIIAEAEKYGISKDELLFDALTMTIGAGEGASLVTLKTMHALKRELGVKTVLGVSNVSFGLPQRPLVNAAFIALATGAGLNAAIMNPADALSMAMLSASAALVGRDRGLKAYIGRYDGSARLALTEEDGRASDAAVAPARSLDAAFSAGDAAEDAFARISTAILKGLSADARSLATAMLDGGELPMSVIENAVLPALNEAGARFECGRLFLPQLLQASTAAQCTFEAIRARIPTGERQSGRTIVLATVKGDVHDIGKNIVKVLLQNYGYGVVDLGRDVPAEAVLDAAQDSGAELIGLSALMTTTVPAMRDTIALIKRELPATKVMVGGAVLTEDYAISIGADFYAADAMGAVHIAQSVFGQA